MFSITAKWMLSQDIISYAAAVTH